MLAYIDTNAWSDICEPGREGWAKSLRIAAEAGRIEPVLGIAVLEELAGLCVADRSLYLRVKNFIKPLVGARIVQQQSDLTRLEIISRGRLSNNEQYLNRAARLAIWSGARRPAFMNEMAAKIRAEGARFKVEDEQRRKQVLGMTGATKSDAMKQTREWWKSQDFRINDWTYDHLRNNREEFGLPADEALWPKPEELPTLRATYAFSLARIRFTVGDGRKIKTSDGYDVQQYAYATYSNLLVTSDGAFKEICDMVERPDLTVETLEEFAQRLERMNAAASVA
jgi:hypothetical protein